MQKRRTNFLYAAALFIIVGAGSLIMHAAGRENMIFKIFGDFALAAKIIVLGIGVVCLVIGLIRLFTGPKPTVEPKPEEKKPEEKKPGE
jgi:hypothetical protein